MNKEELCFTITPSAFDEKAFYNYIIHNLSFGQVLNLYIELRHDILHARGKNDE